MTSTLLSLPLFQGLTMDQMMSILEKVRIDFVSPKDEDFLHRGERQEKILFILKGDVVREMTDPSGRCVLQEHLYAPSLIEFSALFGRDVIAKASYRANGEVTLLSFDKHYMFDIFNHFKVVQMNMLNLLCARIQTLQDKLLQDRGSTIAASFLRMVNSLSESSVGEKQLIVTRVDLADMIGCSRRHMSEEIVKWEEQGLIQIAYGRIIIPDLHLFLQMASKRT